MPNLIGKSLGRYHILEQLGEGGMATVYKAFDTRLEREVAIKVVRRKAFPEEKLDRILKRFEREAKALAKLNHPNIIPIIDSGEEDGTPFLVMGYIPGGTLKGRLKSKPLAWQESARFLAPIARALDYAHKQGIVHRDIKPSNILITDENQPMLTDFGIARILQTEETLDLTGTGMGVGTPEYMAPEQGLGHKVDHRADIYALGIVLYEMVTGRKPFQADTPMAVVIKHINDPLPRPTQFVQNLPRDVERILLKALAKDPVNRYQRMGEFAIALERIILVYETENKRQQEQNKKEELQQRKTEEKNKKKDEDQKRKDELQQKKKREQQKKKQQQKAKRERAKSQNTPRKKNPARRLTIGMLGLLILSTIGWLFSSGVLEKLTSEAKVVDYPTDTLTLDLTSLATISPSPTIAPTLTITPEPTPTSTYTPTPDPRALILEEALEYINTNKSSYFNDFNNTLGIFDPSPSEARIVNEQLVVTSYPRTSAQTSNLWQSAWTAELGNSSFAVAYKLNRETSTKLTCGFVVGYEKFQGDSVSRHQYNFKFSKNTFEFGILAKEHFNTIVKGRYETNPNGTNEVIILVVWDTVGVYVNDKLIFVYQNPNGSVDFNSMGLDANLENGGKCTYDDFHYWNLENFYQTYASQ